MQCKPQVGSTLVELAIVIAVVGIILGITLPALEKPLAYYRLKVAASTLAQDLREIQQKALNEESSSYRFFFEVTNNAYQIRHIEGVLFTVEKRVVFPPSVRLVGTTFDKNNNYLDFTAKGTPYPTGGTITLQDAVSGRFLYVIVASVTGRVRVSTSPPDSWEVP